MAKNYTGAKIAISAAATGMTLLGAAWFYNGQGSAGAASAAPETTADETPTALTPTIRSRTPVAGPRATATPVPKSKARRSRHS